MKSQHMNSKSFLQFYKDTLVNTKHMSAEDYEQMLVHESNQKSNFFYIAAKGKISDKILFNFDYLKPKLEKEQAKVIEIKSNDNLYGCMINVIFKKNAIKLEQYNKWIRKNTETDFLKQIKFSSLIPFLFLNAQSTDSLFCQGTINPSVVEIFSKILLDGCIFINEPDIKKGKENYKFGSNNLCVLSYEKFSDVPQIQLFEKVICIAPSSEDGSIYGDRSNWSVNKAIQNHQKQKEYLKSSLNKLKNDGICVYSTYSINPIENEAVINSVLSEFGGEYFLMDCSKIFKEIERFQGITKWRINGFKSSAKNIDNLHFCMRFYSNLIHSDSTFVAVIKRNALNENEEVKTTQNSDEKKFEKVPQNIVNYIIDKFGFNRNYFNNISFLFLNNCKETLFYVSNKLKSIIERDENQKMRICSLGSPSFTFNKNDYDEAPIPLHDGLPDPAKYPSKRIVSISFNLFTQLISKMKVQIDDFPEETQNSLNTIESGGIFIKVDSCGLIFGGYLDDKSVQLKMSSSKAKKLFSLIEYHILCQTFAIGNQNFEIIHKQNLFYVDKTEFISLWWKSGDIVTLITRPRRFGKTLTLSMVKCFFSNEYKNKGKSIFEGTKIYKEPNMMAIQGMYPVISMSFGKDKSQNVISIINTIKREITNAFRSFENVLLENQDKYNENEIEFIKSINFNMSDETACIAINYLCIYLNRIFDKKVIILLDEYDSPMIKFWTQHDIDGWKCLMSFLQSFFCTTFKENMFLERAIIMGITRICKESIFSGFNNLFVVTTISKKYSNIFGFTKPEVENILTNNQLDFWIEEVFKWYNGYNFGGLKGIFNPWSITNFVKCLNLPTCYWANTSDNELVNDLIKNCTKSVNSGLSKLLQNNNLEISFQENILFNDIYDRKEDSIFSLLVASGYLTITEQVKDNTDEIISISKIPNLEIQKIFNRMIKNWFSLSEISYNQFIKNFVECNIELLNQDLDQLMIDCLSSFDSVEHFYHGLCLGMLIELKNDFDVISNSQSERESHEVLFIPKDISKNKGYIIEFKFQKKRSGGKRESAKNVLSRLAQTALKQIDDNKYDNEFIKKGVSQKNIIKYAIVFYDSSSLVVAKKKK